jgi:hypothetical protein
MIQIGIITQFEECLILEALFQGFRRQHGIGDGRQHREKFLRIVKIEADLAAQEEERRKIKVVSY